MKVTDKITILDLFSGIGGFSKGFQEAGFEIEKHYYSEIDKHAIAVYKHNFKKSIYAGSVDTIRGCDIGNVDIITFGSPCQDFSLAGKRKGMEGQRSSLILHAIRLISELRPRFFIWENVKGAFSSNAGADFWGILQAFANIGGYRLEWQLLNTKWFLPQNRERIYLVGHPAESGRSFRPIFPIGENSIGVDERSPETRSVRTLTAGGNSGGLHSSTTLIKSATTLGYEVATNGDSINLSYPNSETRRGRVGKGVAQTLDSSCNQAIIDARQKSADVKSGKPASRIYLDACPTLNSTMDKDILKVGTWRTHKDGQGFREVSDGNCPTIPARAREDGSGQPVIVQRPRGKNTGNDHGLCPTITVGSFEHNNHVDGIRRLTEIECERLQGFPDNWTEYGIYEKQVWINKKEGTYKIVEGVEKVPKTQRYKMCGNAVTVDVVKELASRIRSNYYLSETA